MIHESKYSAFRDSNIPEINDLNVFPPYRRKKVASELLDELEARAANTTNVIGIGVGLYKDYGNAQNMYGKRGYVLDGRGLVYRDRQVLPGEAIVADDDLLLYLTKNLP